MSSVGADYAGALYGLAKDEGLSQTIYEQIQVLLAAFEQEPAFLRLLGGAGLSGQERCQVLNDSFQGKVHPYVLNLMRIMAGKGDAHQLCDCCRAYICQYKQDHGALQVWAVTAIPLEPPLKKKMIQKLEKLTGRKVELTNRVDPKCLGGVRLEYEGRQIDGTVKTYLDLVAALLKNTPL